ncbi:DNA polymerase [Spelaeicoccus albus]|uniref:DNA-directed DNA polymerase n=1 Tax=Spelaeicoccus albus TaxID=1280376 RepID=A0A7Z0A9K5_9MICO|nr:DNA polymerase [Spelaeicoccus albus]NYI66075.1 DNA polymerase-1 [Spelaeicoccus albus]
MSIVYVDLETADADRLWDYGTGFVRIAGYAVDNRPVESTTDIAAVTRTIEQADLVVGHNVLGFDLLALERYHDLDLSRLVREDRVVDTLLAARQNDPPLSGSADARRYNLDAIAKRLGLDGKITGAGGTALKALAKKFGGFDRIPADHPDYLRYLIQDVELVRELSKHLAVDDYLWREHRVMWRLNHITKHGFRVDVDLAERLIAERQTRVRAQKKQLHDVYGLPLDGKKPHTTTDGKVALEKAFIDLGIEPPRTPTGALATGKEVLMGLEAGHPDNTGLVELCRTLRAFNGERSMAQTLMDHAGKDGRVHPGVDPHQATGRISITNPGLSVMGKRDRGNVCERAMLLPDVGHVLISADLSQIDARAMAMHCQDANYIAALEPGKDMHDEMAAAVFGESGWDRSAGHHPRRGDAKAITHATSYGMGARALADNAGISHDDAERQLAALELKFPGLTAFKTWVRDDARRQVIENAFGRRMRVRPGKEYTQAPAHIGQGTARDLMMEGVLRLPEWLLPGLRAIVHDELVLSVPESRADEAEAAVLKALQFAYRTAPGKTPVPVLADKSDRGRDWADCYRSEKKNWPEVARDHRDLPTCGDSDCTWHLGNEVISEEKENAA